MKIGVLSDTHIPERASKLPEELLGAFSGVDRILHAGDFVSLDVLTTLKKIAPVTAVCGNMDYPEIRKILNAKEIIKINSIKIGLIHGKGHPSSVVKYAKREFIGEKLDVLVVGHSHSVLCEYHGKTLIFNPGSPTDTIFSPFLSYGIIEITDKNEIKPQIIKL